MTLQSSPLFCNHGFRNTCTYNYTIAPYWWMIRPRQCVERKQYNSQSRLHATVQSNGRERSTVNKRPGSRVFTARCYASAVLAMALCPSVRLSVTSRSSTKTAKRRIAQTTSHDTPKTLVFWCQRSPRNSTLRGRRMQVGWVKIGDFRQIAGYISKTVQDRRMVSIKVE